MMFPPVCVFTSISICSQKKFYVNGSASAKCKIPLSSLLIFLPLFFYAGIRFCCLYAGIRFCCHSSYILSLLKFSLLNH
jgi:hypothetical protein